VWWRFADAGEGAARTIWNRDEREALAKAGCPLDEPAMALRRLGPAWERPLRHAADRLILVRPATAAGEASKSHPLWHAIAAGRRHIEERIGVRAEAVLHDAAPGWANRVLAREMVPPATPPVRRERWLAPRAIAAREWESASSLSSLLACPLGWTLQSASALRPGVRQSIASGDRLFGTLAHLIAEKLFQPGAPPDPARTDALARELLEETLPQAAATLLLPGAGRDLAAVRQAIPEALAELARFLHANGLEVAATEQTFEAEASLGANTGVRGAIDLLAPDRTHRPVVIDLKWQRSGRYRRQEIADGVAIQLAVYARHAVGGRGETPAGYFMLRQKRFVTGAAVFKDAVVVEGASLGETWYLIETSWRAIMHELGKGETRAPYGQADVK
jgi:RecB family exonuclease